MPTPICSHAGCSTCREIVVGAIAAQLRTVAEGLRAGLCVEALKLAQKAERRPVEDAAALVEAMIG